MKMRRQVDLTRRRALGAIGGRAAAVPLSPLHAAVSSRVPHRLPCHVVFVARDEPAEMAALLARRREPGLMSQKLLTNGSTVTVIEEWARPPPSGQAFRKLDI